MWKAIVRGFSIAPSNVTFAAMVRVLIAVAIAVISISHMFYKLKMVDWPMNGAGL